MEMIQAAVRKVLGHEAKLGPTGRTCGERDPGEKKTTPFFGGRVTLIPRHPSHPLVIPGEYVFGALALKMFRGSNTDPHKV